MSRALHPLWSLVLALVAPACSAIGDPGGFPTEYPHGGTGVFRPLTPDESGIFDGRAIVLQGQALDASSVTEGHLFYVAAPLLEMPPEIPMDHPTGEVFWPAFGPRRIFRAAPRENPGFSAGSMVLAAEADWEGTDLLDPWVVIDDDGRARLYYAAAGGIGVAEASSIEGPYTRVGDGPILDASQAITGVPRRPSVVRGPDDAWWMYYDAGGAIGIARSEDGRAFTRVDGDPSTPAMDPAALGFDEGFPDVETSEELSVGAPGAVTVTTPIGRRLIRLYFESRRDDDTTRAYVAGTADGITFDRHQVPVLDREDVRFPAPYVLDARVTLLYANTPFTAMGRQTRAITASVSPAGHSFEPVEN
jgi:hypothetical protein